MSILVAGALALGLLGADLADAKRLGGGSSSGLRRSVPTQPAPKPPVTPPNNSNNAAPQAPATPPLAAPAPAPRRSWMGPIAGLAAGLGLAALASHFGFGAAMANAMTLVLIGALALFVIGWFMRRRSPAPQLAGAGAPYRAQAAAAPAVATSSGFDTAGFEQLAKRVFIRLQAANDTGDQADLRRFTTPEMYGVIQQQLLERGGTAQQTEVLQLDASVVDHAEDAGQQIVSVRFRGLVREAQDQVPEQIDEVWHLLRPADGSRDWAIAGIQQTATA
ncbi:Tim44 domain-containing protein [Pelomonas sp. KK5]|uniref:Tim44 domain-containing protein n=1 Tax=Pelomonas sp. KK5 TaxID=1855730 RepID=UPI001E309C83|nr:Tim44-like domain-containing protein [Pelomonas sp. KK5]